MELNISVERLRAGPTMYLVVVVWDQREEPWALPGARQTKQSNGRMVYVCVCMCERYDCQGK
jgi:hypothetical protein